MMSSQPRSSPLRAIIGYVLMIAVAVFGYLLIRSTGSQMIAPEPATGRPLFGAARAVTHGDALPHLLLALVVVIAIARGFGALFAYLAQPPVVGEILVGILLGPSVFGRLAPAVHGSLFPGEIMPLLGMLSQVGIILFMFLIGVELDPTMLRKHGRATLAVSHASIVAPFLLGAALALYVYPTLSTRDVPFMVFALFMGVSMSVTAFPVLARILTDCRMQKTRIGVIALTCAAIDDVTAWCLLALVVSVAQARTAGLVVTFASVAVYIAVMLVVARPVMAWLARLHDRKGRLTQDVMAMVLVMLLVSALATDEIGIHAVFGAFALGVMVPHSSGLARELRHRLEDLVVVLLLPAFFALTGLRTQIGLVATSAQWLLCGVIILVASLGKFGGALAAARLTGLDWRSSAALGVLMNTRGLMELIVLNIGLELRVLSPTLFAMLVLMALVTTLVTAPVLRLVMRGMKVGDEPAMTRPGPLASDLGR